jgi:TonB family protein
MTSTLVLALLLAAIGLPPTPAPAAPFQAPRDTPPPAVENARRERELRAQIASGATPELYVELAALLNKQNRFDELIAALRGAAALEPASAEPQHRIATYYWEKARADAALDAAKKQDYIQQGLDAEDRALAIKPDYMEALVYKNILLRLKANAISDPTEQKRLIAEADGLRNRVLAMQRDQRVPSETPAPGAPSPPPPPFIGFSEAYEQTLARLQPLRVGGNLKTPTKTKDVKPVFPPIAQSARVQGVVILEVVIDEDGSIANAKVLRSIPLLDEAALGAVSQWRFTPTELNGRGVGVIMTVTVNFTLME